MKILIVEDEKDLIQDIKSYLDIENFICETASNYEDADLKLDLYDYDIVLVDITLPGGTGLDLVRKLKQSGRDTGILIISAKNSLDDKLTGLTLGADDYITKPFHLAELNARIKAVIRRRKFKGAVDIVHHEIRINPETRDVSVNKNRIRLTKKEFELLNFFIANKGRLLTRESIAEHLWGDNIDLADNFDFIYTHINNLRKKIVEAGGKDYLQTIYGVGYKYRTE